jgi:hypothetical protein
MSQESNLRRMKGDLQEKIARNIIANKFAGSQIQIIKLDLNSTLSKLKQLKQCPITPILKTKYTK